MSEGAACGHDRRSAIYHKAKRPRRPLQRGALHRYGGTPMSRRRTWGHFQGLLFPFGAPFPTLADERRAHRGDHVSLIGIDCLHTLDPRGSIEAEPQPALA